MNHFDILLKDTRYLDRDLNIKTASVAIRDGRITAFNPDESKADRMIDGRHLLWLPGLVDGHTHTSQQLLRGRLLDEKPVIWKRINVPFEASLTPETSRLSAELCALEMICSGTTGFLDAGGKYVPEFADVYKASGLRGRLSYMTNDNSAMPDALRADPHQALARQLSLIEELGGSILEPVFSVTALTAASKGLIQEIFAEAKTRGIATSVHMNEYQSEVIDFIERYGMRPFEWLDAEDLLSHRFTAAHCLFLSAHEIKIMSEKRVRVIHCPFSNCGKGIPPTPQLLTAGISVGFGSDGSGHGGVDLFREMRLFRGVMNVHWGQMTAEPAVMPAKTLISMATKGGAAILDVDGLGVIEESAPADLIAINVDQPHLFPTHDLVNSVVESASGADVTHMIVDGKLIMKDKEILTLDEARIMHDARTMSW